MGLYGFFPKKHARAAGLAVALLAAGCQEQGAPLHLSVVGDQSIVGQPGLRPASSDQCYINPDFHPSEESPDWFAGVVNTSGNVFGSIFNPITELTVQGFQFASGDKPSRSLALMEDAKSADNRREGMNRLVDFGFLDDPKVSKLFRKRCREIAEHDADPTVRAAAIRVANRGHDALATPIFIKGLNDKNEWIRLESAKALANVPDMAAVDSLIFLIGEREESRDIRVAAADALKHYRTLAVARALSGALGDKSFAISWQARQSLRYLTDRDFGYNGGAWLAYFTGSESPLK